MEWFHYHWSKYLMLNDHLIFKRPCTTDDRSIYVEWPCYEMGITEDFRSFSVFSECYTTKADIIARFTI